ncbi:hypothetical protein DDE83_003690 [Stemphylium lycopersici]|uniref:Uncharacterized protein n=1 Tax=Stemphylium lycopersici TaxID=183478 RepID=A0A364N6S2_STELY|nr:hypothetical protein DDE83_003690 [Stemphylium lycopersici]
MTSVRTFTFALPEKLLFQAMSTQSSHHILFSEPSVIVKVQQTEIDPGVHQLSYPPKLPLKRRVSESFLQTRAYLRKRRRNSDSVQETPIDHPCLQTPEDDVTMPEPWSTFNSAYSTLPTTPHSPTNGAGHALGQPRRPSQVAEFIEKRNHKLKCLFGSRKGSTKDENPQLIPPNARHSSASLDLCESAKHPNIQCSAELTTWNGPSHLPNVSEYFDINGEVGPSSFYTTADWNTFQETFQAQRTLDTEATTVHDVFYDGDTGPEKPNITRASHTQGEKRRRKDSHFSLSDLFRSRRSSKVDKGKERTITEEVDTSQSYAAAGPCLRQIGVLPCVSTDDTSFLVTKERRKVPYPDFSSFEASTPSLERSISPSPSDAETSETPTPAARQVDSRPATRQPRRLGLRIVPARNASTSPCSPSSSESSPSTSPTAIKPSQTQRRLARATAVPSAPQVATEPHSIPIGIPSPRSTNSTASKKEASARLSIHYFPHNLTSPSPSPSASTASCSPNTSLNNLTRHGTRPGSTPHSPSLEPTLLSSPVAMTNLSLEPPQQGMGPSPSHSSERIFHVEVEIAGVSSRGDGRGKDGGGEVEQDEEVAGRVDGEEEVEVDKPDFSITHPAPPPPVGFAEPPSSSSSSSSSESKSPPDTVVQRNRVTDQHARGVFPGQHGFEMGFYGKKGKGKEKRKSIEGECWWEDKEVRLYISPADAIVAIRDDSDHPHDLEKRVFTSPHMKRAFRVAIANTISAITWVIDFTLKEEASSRVTINYKLQSTKGISAPDIEVPSITEIAQTSNQFRGNAKIKLIGTYAGKVVHIYFNGEVFGSDAAMIWQKMISEPVAYINGVQTPIDSWTFDETR